jgi:ribonucleoside-diphosphate reductase alpha chain
MYLFSPYDVERVYGKPMADISVTELYQEMVDDPRIRKSKIKARDFFQRVAELQFESGYPYVVYEDTVNNANPIEGRINMSNLCSEILQVNTPTTYNADLSYDQIGKDISCNLGSLNVAKAMESPDFGKTIEVAIKSLTAVSELSYIDSVMSVAEGNRKSRAIGLGQMNLHGYFGKERMHYGEEESVDFTDIYFMTVAYYAIKASAEMAKKTGSPFDGFENSKYADGSFFDQYTCCDNLPKTDKVNKIFKDSNVHA